MADRKRDPRLAPTQRRDVRRWPVERSHPYQALDQPARLAKWKAEKHLERQAGLNGGIGKALQPSTVAEPFRLPGPCPGQTRSTMSPACAGRRCRMTSSLYGSGPGRDAACTRSNRLDSLTESLAFLCATRSSGTPNGTIPPCPARSSYTPSGAGPPFRKRHPPETRKQDKRYTKAESWTGRPQPVGVCSTTGDQCVIVKQNTRHFLQTVKLGTIVLYLKRLLALKPQSVSERCYPQENWHSS